MKRFVHVIAAAGAALLLTGCEVGMKEWTQTGYRGAALEQITDVSSKVKQGAIPPTPYPLDASMREGERANVTYQNVQVLGDLSTEEFNHLMASMNTWIAPGDGEGQGCNYCHNPENMASDEKYTKIVARKMIQMTRNINANWTSHVQQTGVTCWTCHRGNAVPVNNWSNVSNGKPGLRGNKFGQNTPDASVGYASLPTGMFANYLQGTQNIRVASDKALASPDHVVSIKNTEQTYGLMMHLSQSLGVNCTYCHNSQSFRAWNLSRAQRNTAWYGIRMVRDANDEYIETLAAVFPANRKGPAGDPLKVNCATCHQGQAKPLGGVSMLPEHPQLRVAGYSAGGNATTAAFNAPGAMTSATAGIPTGAGARATTVDGAPRLNVYFATGEAAVTNELATAGSGVLDAVKAKPGAKLVVSGYNDPTGNAAANAVLAKRRAQGVAAALKAAGVSEDRIVLEKPAETTLEGDNAAARRVEVMVRE